MHSLEDYLSDIEARLIPEQEEQLLRDWQRFAEGAWEESFFAPMRKERVPPRIEWPDVNINDAIDSEEIMVIDQFARLSRLLEQGFGGLLTVRSNYGVGILPSLFGAAPFVMPREMNTLPNVRPLPQSDLQAVAESDPPDASRGHGPAVMRVGRMYEEIYRAYPNIGRYVRTDHPDCQGPMDVVELLWGSDLFLALYDRTELVEAMLRTVTDTYKSFLDEWFSISPPKDQLHAYFGNAHLGRICVRDDSAMNLSPEMYERFISPYNDEVLSHFGGGAIHSCGRVDHFSPHLRSMKYLRAFNMSQPEYNDMEIVYRNTVDKGLPVVGLDRRTVDEALAAGRDLHGLVSTTAA